MMAFRRLTRKRRTRRTTRRSYRKTIARRRYRRLNQTRAVFRTFVDTDFTTKGPYYNYFNNSPRGLTGWSYYASQFHNYKCYAVAVKYVPRATTAPMETNQTHYNASLYICRDFGNSTWGEEGDNLIRKALSIRNCKIRDITKPFTLFFKCGKGSPSNYVQTCLPGFMEVDHGQPTETFHMISEKLSLNKPGRFYFTYYVSFINKRYTITPVSTIPDQH